MAKTVTASLDEPAQKIIDRCGVETIRKDPVQWSYEGKVIKRPEIHRWEEVMKEEFGIEILYAE